MEKTYNPEQIEQKWYTRWEQAKFFVSSGKGDPYCIVIPPPNVTGSLHMGHGFQLSIMDALIRYKRMQGCDTLWQCGTDHAGIATQILVERQLEKVGATKQSLGREKFVDKIWQWKNFSGGTICKQQRRLGISVDWSRERFTMDPDFVDAVNKVFVSLYNEGLIYRGKKLVNWDPVLHTAISDLEVVNEEVSANLWHIKYLFADKNDIVNLNEVQDDVTANAELDVLGKYDIDYTEDDDDFDAELDDDPRSLMDDDDDEDYDYEYDEDDDDDYDDDDDDDDYEYDDDDDEDEDDEDDYEEVTVKKEDEVILASDGIIIATSRPETIFGDVAIAVHPEDKRYKHLIGKKVIIPIINKEIPIIADEAVLMDFGSGCVKITPAHDFNDYAMGQRHNLELINIFTPDATLSNDVNVPETYRGLDRFVARDKVIAELQTSELLIKITKYETKIPKGDRSGVVIEPYLTDQWFMKTKELAEPAMEVVKSGEMKFYPDNWSKVYLQWLENIEDWCISRQLWWGHRIPAWYDESGKVYVAESEELVRKNFNLNKKVVLKQDEDVLDTWFSSALWPFVTMGWPNKTPELEKFYPTNVLVTGFDIIFFWVARMVMLGLKFTKKIPFHEVYITGLIRDSKGKKMSKSKGNIIDPVDLIDGISLEKLLEKRTNNLMQPQLVQAIEQSTKEDFPNGISAFGADALRFTFCALASTGRDINFDFGRLEGYRNFCTKLWNATRFVLMQFQAVPLVQHNDAKHLQFSMADRWIKAKFHLLIKDVDTHFKDYRFDLIAQAIYDFFWHEYCDWYLELCKSVLHADYINPAISSGAKRTLVGILEAVMRLIHPLMPFISEELWQQVAPYLGIKPSTVMLQRYPIYDEKAVDRVALHEIEWLKKVIVAVRNIRGEMNIAPKRLLQLKLSKGCALDKKYLDHNKLYLLNVAKLESVEWITDGTVPFSATAIVDGLELHILMDNIIDKNAEIWRLNKEINKMKIEQDRAMYKLRNQEFIKNAPKELVARERQRLTDIQNTLMKLRDKLSILEKSS